MLRYSFLFELWSIPCGPYRRQWPWWRVELKEKSTHRSTTLGLDDVASPGEWALIQFYWGTTRRLCRAVGLSFLSLSFFCTDHSVVFSYYFVFYCSSFNHLPRLFLPISPAATSDTRSFSWRPTSPLFPSSLIVAVNDFSVSLASRRNETVCTTYRKRYTRRRI